MVVAATLAVLDQLAASTELRDRPIVPIMLGDARLAQTMASDRLAAGIYVIGFSYPVVPKGQARIRVQLSAAHTTADLDQAIAVFKAVAR